MILNLELILRLIKFLLQRTSKEDILIYRVTQILMQTQQQGKQLMNSKRGSLSEVLTKTLAGLEPSIHKPNQEKIITQSSWKKLQMLILCETSNNLRQKLRKRSSQQKKAICRQRNNQNLKFGKNKRNSLNIE